MVGQGVVPGTGERLMAEPMMTVQQASKFLQIDPDTLRSLARRGRVPGMKIGRQWRFAPVLLRQWIQDHSLGNTGKRPRSGR